MWPRLKWMLGLQHSTEDTSWCRVHGTIHRNNDHHILQNAQGRPPSQPSHRLTRQCPVHPNGRNPTTNLRSQNVNITALVDDYQRRSQAALHPAGADGRSREKQEKRNERELAAQMGVDAASTQQAGGVSNDANTNNGSPSPPSVENLSSPKSGKMSLITVQRPPDISETVVTTVYTEAPRSNASENASFVDSIRFGIAKIASSLAFGIEKVQSKTTTQISLSRVDRAVSPVESLTKLPSELNPGPSQGTVKDILPNGTASVAEPEDSSLGQVKPNSSNASRQQLQKKKSSVGKMKIAPSKPERKYSHMHAKRPIPTANIPKRVPSKKQNYSDSHPEDTGEQKQEKELFEWLQRYGLDNSEKTVLNENLEIPTLPVQCSVPPVENTDKVIDVKSRGGSSSRTNHLRVKSLSQGGSMDSCIDGDAPEVLSPMENTTDQPENIQKRVSFSSTPTHPRSRIPSPILKRRRSISPTRTDTNQGPS